jgi:hypothetical protein
LEGKKDGGVQGWDNPKAPSIGSLSCSLTNLAVHGRSYNHSPILITIKKVNSDRYVSSYVIASEYLAEEDIKDIIRINLTGDRIPVPVT